MTAHLPPKPPAARSPKGPGESDHVQNVSDPKPSKDVNTDEQAEAGNIHENTTGSGQQQNR